MIERIKQLTNKKMFHLVMMIIIIVVILFLLGITILKYNVEGETNMPFVLKKIVIINQVEGKPKQAIDPNNKWAYDISENNDIYIYIDKNSSYTKEETIKSVYIDNITIEKLPETGQGKFYHPEILQENVIFSNSAENASDSMEYDADVEANLKNMKISNQGGIIAFRYAIENIASYEGNEEEINHNELLKKAEISLEKIKSNFRFDLTIKLDSGKEFKTTIPLELPIDNVVEEGVTSKEITDVSQYIFKRTQN